MRKAGLEPTRPKALDSESSKTTSSITCARTSSYEDSNLVPLRDASCALATSLMVREAGVEPARPKTLGSRPSKATSYITHAHKMVGEAGLEPAQSQGQQFYRLP